MTTAGEINVKLGLNSETFIKSMDEAEKELKVLESRLSMSQKHFDAMAKAIAVTKNPTKEMTDSFKKLKEQLIQDKNAYSAFESKLKKLDGGLTQNNTMVNQLRGSLGKLVSAGAVIALGKQIIDYGKKSVEAYRLQERAIKSLDTALKNSGVYTAEYSQHIQKLAGEIQSFSNYGDEAIEKAVGLGQAYSGNVKLTDELIKSTVDFAAATGTDLETAFTLVGKSIGTETNALARYGVSLDQNMTKEQKAAAIAQAFGQRFQGSARDMADASVQLKNALGDLSEGFGELLNPAVQKTENYLLASVQRLTQWINQVNVLKKDIAGLSLNDIEERLKLTSGYIAELRSGSFIKGYGPVKEDNQLLQKYLKEQDELIARYKKIQNAAKSTEIISASNKSPSGKTAQDKTLEAYKKYIDEYNKLNDDYASVLKARQYVEGELNIDPVKQQAEYDKLIDIYKNHYSKMAEITRSGAKNKAEIEKLEEQKLANDLQELRITKERETQQKLADITKSYKDVQHETALDEQIRGELGGFIGQYQTGYTERLNLLKWYYQEREKLAEIHFDSMEQQSVAYYELEKAKSDREAQLQADIWRQRGQEITSIFNQTFDSMLTNYGNFSENMQQLVLNLSRYILKESFQQLIGQISQLNESQNILGGFVSRLTGSFQNLSGSMLQTAASTSAAAASSAAMTASQAALVPIQKMTSQGSTKISADYASQAAAAQELALATAQLAVAEAANSVAKIPYAGGFLAPAAAALTGAAIAAATAMVAGSSLLGRFSGGGLRSVSGNSGAFVSGSGGGMMLMPETYHSGGIVPGTKEQLAVLQGGERILNRSENADYTNGENGAENGVNNIMVFNIKAWDGKDVINTLKANEQTINQIVAGGIKNNKQGLRTMVQNT